MALSSSGGSRSSDSPRTWLLASPHQGDNSQLLALAQALDWPFEIKHLRFKRGEKLLRFAKAATLAAVDQQNSDELLLPGPDLVLLSGRPNEAVAFWIKRHLNPAVKLVFIGTPQWPLDRYDLVIATPQYALPQRENILHIPLPLHGVNADALDAARAEWAARFAHLPKPHIAVLIGGSSGPYVFTAAAARRLVQEAGHLAQAKGGSLLVTTSARTPRPVLNVLTAQSSVPTIVHQWQQDQSDNPFFGMLAHADEIIVTADSISMISEAIATGKPVLLFDIDEGRFGLRAEDGRSPLPPPGWRGRTAESTAFRILMRLAPARWTRDLRVVHRAVTEAGLARWLGHKAAVPAAVSPGASLQQSLLRVRQLFGL